MRMDPEAPSPGEEVTISLESFLYNLDTQNITWYINSKQVKEGIGATTLQVTAPGEGASAEVSAQAGNLPIVSVTLHPIFIDLLWEAQTITPPWYKGRALPTDGSYIKAVAKLNPNNNVPKPLQFKWYKGTKLIKQSAQADANILITKAPQTYRSYILSVDVSDAKGNLLGRAGSNIQLTNPELILYRNNPLLGVLYNTALQASSILDIQESEPSFTAVPFYLTLPSEEQLKYTWNIPGVKYTRDTADTITIVSMGEDSTNISVEVSNPEELFQSAQRSYSLPSIPKDASINNDNIDAVVDSPFNAVQ